MLKKLKTIKLGLLAILFITVWLFGVAVGHYKVFPFFALATLKVKIDSLRAGSPPLDRKDSKVKIDSLRTGSPPLDRKVSTGWSSDIKLIEITSSVDRETQKAYFRASKDIRKPLVVSLHTWSGDYAQSDPLVSHFKEEDWNYIHPDFRGPNWTFNACLSQKAMQDIDDAIAYSIQNGNVDPSKIIVVGASGGGYATLGSYLKSSHRLRAHLAWVPISDLKAWYLQSKQKKQDYAENVVQCTSREGHIDFVEMEKRSPLYWETSMKDKGILEIYAGVNDGFDGSVPISHSILFFNKIAVSQLDYSGRVSPDDMIKLLSRDVSSTGKIIEGRDVLYSKESGKVKLTIFQGGHEMLVGYTIDRIKDLIGD